MLKDNKKTGNRMNPIRIIPNEHLLPRCSFCPECFGKLERCKSKEASGVYQCVECGLLYAHPNNIKKESDDTDVLYVTVRTYFKYRHLKNFIMHISYDYNDDVIEKYATCNIDGKIVHLDFDNAELKKFLSCVNEIYEVDHSQYKVDLPAETFHLTMSLNGRNKAIHGNFDLVEIVPGMGELMKIMFTSCHQAAKTIIARSSLAINVVV